MSKPETTKPDLSTPEGMDQAMKIIRREEFNRFCDLQRQLINQIRDPYIQEKMFNALATLEVINAE